MKTLLSLFVVLSCSIAIAQTPEASSKEHKFLAQDVGTWTGFMTMYEGDTESPKVKIREVNTLLGDLWLLSEFEGGPMKGRGQFGYDKRQKKYVGTWIDGFSSHLSIAEGHYNEETKQLVMMFTGIDPNTGAPHVLKGVTTREGNDKRQFIMYMKHEDAWVKAFMIDYKRETP